MGVLAEAAALMEALTEEPASMVEGTLPSAEAGARTVVRAADHKWVGARTTERE
jgi:hypothetical protein